MAAWSPGSLSKTQPLCFSSRMLCWKSAKLTVLKFQQLTTETSKILLAWHKALLCFPCLCWVTLHQGREAGCGCKGLQEQSYPDGNGRKAVKLTVVAGWFGTSCRAQWTHGAHCQNTLRMLNGYMASPEGWSSWKRNVIRITKYIKVTFVSEK